METKAIIHDVPPYLTVYSDGTVDRLLGTETSPPSLNHPSGVSSKDILINPKTGLSARLYLPTNLNHDNKLPVVVYFHGGAFIISSASDPLYHNMLNLLVKEAGVVLVSVDYRLAPENPLPTAYDDSWESLEWVYEHMSGDGSESWLKEHGDFDRVFLAGDSGGANISHHMAIRLTECRDQGMFMLGYLWHEIPSKFDHLCETIQRFVLYIDFQNGSYKVSVAKNQLYTMHTSLYSTFHNPFV